MSSLLGILILAKPHADSARRMMHCGRGRMNPLNIEYMHLGICLGFIQDIFTEALMSHPRLSIQRKVSLVRAIGKIIWIQNDLFAKWFVRDGDEFADEMPDVNSDKEGYIGNKKILGDSSPSGSSNGDDHSSVTSDTPQSTNTAKCPFSVSGASSPFPSSRTSSPFPTSRSSTPSVETKIWAD